MPTIIGSKSGTRPYLELDWSITSQNVANNQSTINLKLYLRVEYSIGYNARYTGVLQGQSFTANAGYLSSPGRYLIAQRDITVGHNSDGTKTQSFSASYNISITWGGTYHSSISLSGSGTLTPIPRASTLSAFSFASSLQAGTANTINYTVTRHSGNFRHQIQLRDGSVTLASWDNVSSNGSNTLSLTGTNVNTILGRMSTVTSKSFTLRIATRSGHNEGFVGNAVTRNASVSVNANVKPTISSPKAVPIGNSWAVGKGLYVQGQTGVSASFVGSAIGGAGVKSRSIDIAGTKGGSLSGSTFSLTRQSLPNSGDIKIKYSITDTRDRTTTSEVTITVLAYTPPQITTFNAYRANPKSTAVTVVRKGTTHTLGGRITASLKITETLGTGATKELETIASFTNGFDSSKASTVSTGTSATYTLIVTDTLGNTATATVTVGTAFMELSIRKGVGVGMGKVHERGSLDVDGEAFFNGDLFVNNVNVSNAQALSSYLSSSGLTAADTISFWQTLPSGVYWVYGQIIPNQPSNYGFMIHNRQAGFSGADWTTMWHSQAHGPTYRKSGNGTSNRAWEEWGMPARAVTGDNWYTRFSDGTQIILGTASIDRTGDQYVYTVPANFLNDHPVGNIQAAGNAYADIDDVATFETMFFRNGFRIRKPHTSTVRGSGKVNIRYMAIGRWK